MRCSKLGCGGTIDIRIVEFGRVVYDCPTCARKKARLCKDCPAPTPSPWRWRCVSCYKTHRRAQERERDRERYGRRRKKVLAAWKKRMRDPAFRAHRAAYMRRFRNDHPRDDFDRAYQRAYMTACRANPEYVEQYNARRRELRQQRRKAS